MDLNEIGLKIPEILLPRGDFETWAVVACDQYTSQREVWDCIESKVGGRPSALRLMLPEVYLEDDDVDERRKNINSVMREYLEGGVFGESVNSMIYVERETSSGMRPGLVAAVDLDEYDYTAGSRALIRSTEETIADRLPPRVAIRMKAELEMPHIMLLIDDSEHIVLSELGKAADEKAKLYDFDLMTDGGHIKGYAVSEESTELLARSLKALKEKNNGFLYAVGDGNHSLATAKECWELTKKSGTPNEKAKYALVEIVNLHDDSLVFEPIHRVLYNCGKDAAAKFEKILYGVTGGEGNARVTYVSGGRSGSYLMPGDRLSVAYIEEAVEIFLKENQDARVDYVHGDSVAEELGSKEGSLSIILPAFDKNLLFSTVAEIGQLPRKSFSMGHAYDKRYYIECRKIR